MIAKFSDLKYQQLTASRIGNLFARHDTCGFGVKHFMRSALHIPEHTLAHHTFHVNLGEPLNVSWKAQGKWVADICKTGNIIGLLSCGEKEEINWQNEHSALEVTFDPFFIDTIVEKDNFKFSGQRNISDPFLSNIAATLSEIMHNTFIIEKLWVESVAVTCAIHLVSTYPSSNKKIHAPKGKLSAYQLKNVIEFVHSNIQGSITLECLASLTHLSIFHFARMFKNTLRVSPYQFVLQLKIDFAKRLIKHKTAIGDIAYRLGFTDIAHFCNSFKKYTGFSPLQFYSLNHNIIQIRRTSPFSNNTDALK